MSSSSNTDIVVHATDAVAPLSAPNVVSTVRVDAASYPVLNWSALSEDGMMERIYAEIERDLRETVADVLAIKDGERTWDSTMAPLGAVNTRTGLLGKLLVLPMQLHPDGAVRQQSASYSQRLTRLVLKQLMVPGVYRLMVELRNKAENGVVDLTPEQLRILDRDIHRFKEQGHALGKAGKRRMREIAEESARVAAEFSRNLNSVDMSFTFTAEELRGLPADILERCRQEDGVYLLTLNTPDYMPAIEFVESGMVRERLYRAFLNRCSDTNVPLVEQTIALRCESAALLGHPNYATGALERKMAGSPERVSTFLNELLVSITPAVQQAREDMLELKRELLDEFTVKSVNECRVEAWDVNYLTRILTERRSNLDMAELRNWFRAPQVVAGTLEVYQRLLGLRFVQRTEGIIFWHENTTFYEVYDANHGHLVGAFYLDIYPREGKFPNACCASISDGRTAEDGTRNVPTAAMLCNFPENTGLMFRDVETFFHEFGHVMHHICNESQYTDFNAFDVESDFLEAPSQMLEYWCRMPEVLAILSRNPESGESLPADIVEKLQSPSQISLVMNTAKQIAYALMDMDLHNGGVPLDLGNLCIDTLTRCTGIQHPDGINMFGSFGHVMSGYAAGYYGYQWSLVYATDMFATRFLRDGVLNPTTGAEYRRTILAPGSSHDAIDMVTEFLGRAPSTEAYGRYLAGTLFNVAEN
jgi:Zn-dependent oligopeptidase